MIFKRRKPLSFFQTIRQQIYPRGGWSRAIGYMQLRLRRLPDTPEKIGRGVFAGVFVCFTPLFGLHMVLAWLLAKLVRGNVLAALLATFFGNPLTFVAIGAISLRIGHLMLGQSDIHINSSELGQLFAGSWQDLKLNARALWEGTPTNWEHLQEFYQSVFLPYLLGGLVPALLSGLLAYIIVVPVIRAYQNRRYAKLRKKLEQLEPNTD